MLKQTDRTCEEPGSQQVVIAEIDCPSAKKSNTSDLSSMVWIGESVAQSKTESSKPLNVIAKKVAKNLKKLYHGVKKGAAQGRSSSRLQRLSIASILKR